MTMVETAIIATKTVTLLLGGGITYIALKAYRRTGDASLRALSVGFGIVTLGALLGGIADQVVSVSLEMGVLINSLLVMIGFVIIMYSLSIER